MTAVMLNAFCNIDKKSADTFVSADYVYAQSALCGKTEIFAAFIAGIVIVYHIFFVK